jgi:hypothetical protein
MQGEYQNLNSVVVPFLEKPFLTPEIFSQTVLREMYLSEKIIWVEA